MLCWKSPHNSCERDPKEVSLDKAKIAVIYRMQIVRDTNNMSGRFSDNFVLHIGDSISCFQSLGLIEFRKNMKRATEGKNNLTNEEHLKILQSLPPASNRTGSFFRVYKNYPKGKITTRDRVFSDPYVYSEELNLFKWEITGHTNEYKGFRTLHAKTQYAGREWNAWFAPDIPFSEGPYKFHGLPGLIVQLGDSNKQIAIVMEAIVEVSDNEAITHEISPGEFKTTLSNFIKVRNQFTQNAAAIIRGFTNDPHTHAVATRNVSNRNNFIERSAD